MRTKIVIFLINLIVFSACTKKIIFKQMNVIPQYALIEKKDDIYSFSDSCIIPYIYKKVISLNDLPIEEKKEKFVQMLLPSILVAQHDLNQKLKRVEHIKSWLEKNTKLIEKDSIFLFDLYDTYQCTEIDELKQRLKPHPASIVLGQAALESGWGSSRFFDEGNNVFGIWSYNSNEDRIKALVARDSTIVFVRKYSDLEESVNDYFKIIANVDAYSDFREKRMESNNPYELIPLLNRYSEVGDVYTSKLIQLIQNNGLTHFDNYQLNSDYLKEEVVVLSKASLKIQ